MKAKKAVFEKLTRQDISNLGNGMSYNERLKAAGEQDVSKYIVVELPNGRIKRIPRTDK